VTGILIEHVCSGCSVSYKQKLAGEKISVPTGRG